jgi:hypothetical protein
MKKQIPRRYAPRDDNLSGSLQQVQRQLFEFGVRALVEGRAQHGLDFCAKVSCGRTAFVLVEGVFVLPDLI